MVVMTNLNNYFLSIVLQIASSNEMFMCVGPMIENRFSFCYNPRDEDIFFSLSILKSYSLDFNTKDVGKCLLEALWDMYRVLCHGSDSD